MARRTLGEELTRVRALRSAPLGRRTTLAAARALGLLDGSDGAVGNGQLSAAAAAARLTDFQRRSGLDPSGTADVATLQRLVAEVSHRHVSHSAMRTARVQGLLEQVGFAPAADEVARRRFGDSTVEALRRFQESAGLAVDGLVGEATLEKLRDQALTATLSTKRQIARLQRTLLRAARNLSLEVRIDGAEMKARQSGPTTQAAVRTLQERLGLPVTGTVDPTTFERVGSVAASRIGPAAKVPTPDPAEVTTVPRQLRLNMSNKHVPTLQRALAFLGHQADEKEFKDARFGASTRRAVLAFQAAAGLPQSGAVDARTLRAVNRAVSVAVGTTHAHRIRGSVRDTAWQGRPDVTVTLSTNPPVGEGVVLASRRTLANGFYDLPYDVPKDPSSGQPVSPLSLQVTFTDQAGQVIGAKTLQEPTPIAWANFTEGPYPYQGPSRLDTQLAAVEGTGAGPVGELHETASDAQVTRVAQLAGLSQDDVMRLVLASRAAPQLSGQLDVQVCYAFLAQSLPTTVPDDLLAQTHEWTLIDQLTDLVASGIAFTDQELARSTLESALSQNLVPVTLAARLDAVLADLTSARRRFALDRPLLVGNGTLRQTLERSTVPATSYDGVADVFVQTGGMGPKFWTALREDPGRFGGPDAVASLETGVDVGLVAKNFGPMVALLSDRIGDPAHTELTSTRDLAKLTDAEWSRIVADGGGAVPPNTDGASPAEQQATYARTMAAQSQTLFPTVAVTAAVKRSDRTGLTRIDQIEQLVDEHPDLELRVSNIDAFVAAHDLAVDDATHSELRVLQRVNRLAPTADTARALLDNGLHSAMQIVALGPDELVRRLEPAGVDSATALSIHGYAEYQYAQVLHRLTEFRSELQTAMPAALAPQTLTAEQRGELLSEIPDLELLFGPLDVCDCPHCASVYGPAAYLADVLRFLDAHRAETGNRTVREVLAERRPEVGSVKLDCRNTETPLPYIDLTNEVLEAAMPGSAGHRDLQTTWTADELRAAPEHQDGTVYDLLRGSDVPISSSFDLWQEQTRVFLNHLGVPRWRLMEAFRTAAGDADETDTAAEYFGLSSHESTLVTGPRESAQQQSDLWGFDATRTRIPVPEVLARSGFSYGELLLLLQTHWITPANAPRVVIDRPADSADLKQQNLVNVTPVVLDRLHRLLRLRRHTDWDVWELDLLVRASRVTNGVLDGPGLAALHAAAALARRLGMRAEHLAGWFGQLPTEGHPSAADPTDLAAAAPSAYAAGFLSRAVSDPPDPAFDPEPDGSDLGQHRTTLLAAIAVTDPQLTALLERTGTVNDLATLSTLSSWSGLARALRTDLSDLLLTADILVPVVADPFASPRAMLDFLDLVDELRRPGLSIAETDFLLSRRPDSPLAPSDETVALALSALRESMRSNPAASPRGQVTSWLVGPTRLTPELLGLLLAESDATGALRDAFEQPDFTERGADGGYVHPVTAAAFPRLFEVYRRLLKMARVVEVLALDPRALAWLLAHRAAVGAVRLVDLPVDTAPAAPLASGWVALLRWWRNRIDLTLRSATVAAAPGQVPAAPIGTMDQLVVAASTAGADPAEVRARAAELTGLDTGTLHALDGDVATTYAEPVFLRRLLDCAGHAQRLGVTSDVASVWAVRERPAGLTESEVAAQTRAAAKSKYDRPGWLSVLTPIQDTLREHKRDALVAFLLDHAGRTEPETVQVGGTTFANPRRWTSPDDLLRYFLIDVEMSSCQLTSRVKQMIGSVQMFVQRAFLNLEKPHVVVTSDEKGDLASPNSWRQWKWMKSYRLWEANRKIFLYPENWVEPELRDDKTPFFVELEQEILHSDVTSENCETALRHYLEKVQEVGSLEVVGVYHEIDDDHPWDNLPASVNVLHVIGRTRGVPFRYYYRGFDLNRAQWSPWERVDLDITGEQVAPVVYNRVLHLFWLQVTEKAQSTSRQPAAQATSSAQQAPDTPRQMELKLAWSVRSGSGWAAKQVSPHTLVHPWKRPESSYTLKPRYHSVENQLWLDVYVSMSLEFNNRPFWDPYSGLPSYLTARRFDETARPWHSSSFVFEGHVADLRFKPLRGQYHVLDGAGLVSQQAVDSDSLQYVRALSDPQGRLLKALSGTGQVSARLAVPDGMHLEAGRLRNNTRVPNNGSFTVLQSGNSVALLTTARSPFALVNSLHRVQLDTAADRSPFFYTDASRSYFVTSQWANVTIDSTTTVQRLQYTFSPFHHPYVALFVRELNRSGVDGLLNRALQRFPEQYPPGNAFDFTAAYHPVAGTAAADPSAQKDTIDFSRSGAMSVYNWEIFFHVPFLIACKLTTNQRFEEALDWFHRIFDPTNTEAVSAPQRFWVTKPFFDQNADDYRRQRIESILADANLDTVQDEIREWRNHPFVPDVIARFRPVAYQKVVVMKYIDALVAWGDQLFRRETIESINEATLLYVLAGELLGRRPEHVPAVPRDGRSYDELTAADALDPFGNQRVEVQLENFTERPTMVVAAPDGGALPVVNLSYFGIPANTELIGYWDVIADRLFKIRHCMDLSGTVRQLPLFEPPIDPSVLVRAIAAGVDLDSVLEDVAAGGSPYRFRTLLDNAMSLAVDVRALGERMLAALDRRDAEAMARLQAGNESGLQLLVADVRAAQVLEAQRVREAAEKGRDLVQRRIDYYSGLPYMNAWETASTVVHGAGVVSQIVATVLNAVAGGTSLVPSATFGAAGFGGSPVATVTYGGEQISSSSANFARLFDGIASILHSSGAMLETQGGYQRQFEGNQFQAASARDELDQLEKQIISAQAREAAATAEQTAQARVVENAQGVEELLRSKYTSTELFDWNVAQLSTVYFQAYQLAFDMARRAERAYRFETGDQESPPMIQFGYWDSLKKGLLSGDRLVNDLRRLEGTFLQRNTRRLQATTHVSLATLMADKLLELKVRGTTSIELPEWLLASENPGWFNQRIVRVAVSAPCTAGPYVGVHAGLTLTQARVRVDDSVGGGFGDAFDANDTRFADAMCPVTSIRTSHGGNDRGTVDGVGFADDRYTAFEGAGLVSRWTITLDPRDNAFDVSTLTDFVLSIDYEGDQGGPALVDLARDAVEAALPSHGARLFSLDGSFAGEWFRFLHPDAGQEQRLDVSVRLDDLPYLHRRAAHTRRLTALRTDLVLLSEYVGQFDVRIQAPGGGAPPPVTPGPRDPAFGDMHHAVVSWPANTRDLLGGWQISVKRDVDATWDLLPDDLVVHAWLLIQFSST